MNFLQLVFCISLLVSTSVMGKIPLEYSVKVIQGIYHQFHSKFVFILSDTMSEDIELIYSKELQFLNKMLSKTRVYVSTVELIDLNTVLNTKWQGHRLPLVVIPLGNPSIQDALNQTAPNMAEWLFFQSELSPLDNLFNLQYMPLDVEFIVAQWHPEDIIKLTEVYHIEPNSPLQTVTVGSWTPRHGLHWRTPGFYKRRRNLNKLVFKVVVSEDDLPTKLFRDETGKVTGVGGFFGKIWTELETRLNFSSSYYESTEDSRGIQLTDGSWVGMIGNIVRKEADVAIGALTMYPSCLNVTDFLIPLLDDNTNMYIREVETLELHWSSFLLPFKQKLWFSVIGALVLLTGALIFSLHMGKPSKLRFNFQNFLESFYCIYGAFCGQGRERTPKSWPSRIVFLTSFFVGYVLGAAYSAALVSFLTVQRSELPFTSFRGLLQDGTYKLGVTVGAEISYFSESKNGIMKKLYNELIATKKNNFHENVLEGFERLCKEDKYALVTSDMWLLRLRSGDVPCNIQKVPHTKIPGSVSIAITKENPFRNLFNHNLRQMWLSGILEKLRQRYWYKDIPKINRKSFGVTFTAVAPIFTILAVGIIISFLFLLFECGIFIFLQTLY